MGQALYRKYRSKSLDEIIGQQHITLSLKHALKDHNISHAYLLTGPKGVGKTSVARILAYAVNDVPYSDESEQLLDIIEIDAASHRRIEEMRDLREKVNFTPSVLKYKVYIIDEVHMLTKEAFNALLKTLEEPPAHVIFILATTELSKVPETIISRTQRYNFKPVSKDKVIEHLKVIAKAEKIVIDDQAIELIAVHGRGSFRDSISLLDQIRNQSDKITVDSVLDTIGLAPSQVIDSIKAAVSASDKLQLLRILTDIDNNGYDPAIIASQLAENIRSDIFEDHDPSANKRDLALLSDLLDVRISSNPSVALELALLESLSPATTSAAPTIKATAPAPKIAANEVVAKKEVEHTAIDSLAENVELEIKPPEPDHNPIEYDKDEAWHGVLDIIKKTHNTLYSILRVAQPTWEEDKITIAFQFPFHQKKMIETANNEVVSKAIKEVIQKKLIIECIVDPTIVSAPNEDAAIDESPIDNISNIFGGAELIESEV
jgi:DNA polymerase-3 subunit gamma/tau